MSESVNVGEIAAKLSREIFRFFFWQKHQKHDDNFSCTNPKHVGEGEKPKISHPGDVVFYYRDPYLGKKIYLHTDLKSYKKESINSTTLRSALRSLCMTVDCANYSENWREKYSIDTAEQYEVRGLLFMHNHDHGYDKPFYEAINKINLQALPIATDTIVHFLGPHDIQRLYNICNDIIRLQHADELSKKYTFYYPDLVMLRRQGSVWDQPATIELLTSPYIIIKHEQSEQSPAGYIIYYNRSGDSHEEFEYLLDSLSRYQMLDSGERIRVRVTNPIPNIELKSIFQTAKNRYARVWGFDPAREKILSEIEIDYITSVTDTYNPGYMGWRE